MRTIKFRGKTKDGNWVFGDLLTNHKTPEILAYKGQYEVEEETIGQYIGLVDKNGKEIFEGDIVKKTKSGWGGIVLWNSRGYFYIKDSSFYEDEEPDLSPIGSLLCCSRKELEIIGNIHDNKDLIKGE